MFAALCIFVLIVAAFVVHMPWIIAFLVIIFALRLVFGPTREQRRFRDERWREEERYERRRWY